MMSGMRTDDTPIDRGDGSALYVQNARLTVKGEMRRRRGMSRTTLDKQSYPIIGIGVASPPTGPIIVLEGTTALDGFGMGNNLAGDWGDVQLKAPTGSVLAVGQSDAVDDFTITVNGVDNGDGLIDSDALVEINTGGDNGNTYRVTMVADIDSQLNSTDPGDSVDHVLGVTWNSLNPVYNGASANPGGTNLGWVSPTFSSTDLSALTILENHAFTIEFDVEGGDTFDWVVSNSLTPLIGNYNGALLSGTIDVSVEQLDGLSAGTYTITIDREDDFATSFDLYAKSDFYPTEEGDGVFVGNYPIDPDNSSVSAMWTPPAAGTWSFSAVARRGEQRGPMGQIGTA